MPKLYLLLFLTCLPPHLLHAQHHVDIPPDFKKDNLAVVWGKHHQMSPADISASAQLKAHNNQIIIEVKVVDDFVISGSDQVHSDHVEIWLSLPEVEHTAYATYYGEPNYGQGTAVDSTERVVQLFPANCAWDKGNCNWNNFVELYKNTGNRNRMYDYQPHPEELNRSVVFWGMTHYGLYPDGRPTVQFDQKNYHLIEKKIGAKLGNMALGVQYETNYTVEGYTITATIDLTALGFVQLPKTEQIRALISVIDVDEEKQETVLASNANYQWGVPTTFSLIDLQQPLTSNFSTISTATWAKINDSDTEDIERYKYIFTEHGWTPFAIDLNRVVFGYKDWNDIYELGILPLLMGHERLYTKCGTPYEKLTIEAARLYEWYPTRVYFVLYDQIVPSISTVSGLNFPETKATWTHLVNEPFCFENGALGLLTYHTQQRHPIGWGECGRCVDDTYTMLQISAEQKQPLFHIFQDNGSYIHVAFTQTNCSGMPYAKPQPKQSRPFQDYVINRMEWKKKGEDLDIELVATASGKQTREYLLRYSWNDSMACHIQQIYPQVGKSEAYIYKEEKR